MFQKDQKKRVAELKTTNYALTIQNREKNKQAAVLNRASHLYAFLSQVNQKIVRIKDEQLLFKNACEIAIAFGNFKVAWIGLFDVPNIKITLTDHIGVPEEYLSFFNDTEIKKNGPQEFVLQTGKPYVSNDVLTAPDLKSWVPLANDLGVNSCMILPIKKMGKVIATFNLYAVEAGFFYKDEIKILDELAGDISFAIDLFEKDKVIKRSEEQLLKNELRYRALIENGADAVAIISSTGKILYISPPVQKILGYTEEEAIALDMFELVHPDDIAIVAKVWDKALSNEGLTIPGALGRIRHKNGTWRWLDATLTNMLNNPAVNGIIDNFRDVTDYKIAEDALHLTQFALDNAGDAVFWITPDARFFKVNQSTCLMLGYAEQEMLQLSVPDIDPYYQAKKWAVHFEELKQKGSIFFETVQKAKDGRLIPVEIRANYIKFGDKEYNCAFSRDISARKLAEELLMKSEAFNRGVLNALSSHITVIDSRGNQIAVNDAWSRFATENECNDLMATGVGSNYFEVCERSALTGDAMAAQVLMGIKEVMDEKTPAFYLEYPCHSPLQQRWFGLLARKFEIEEPMVVIAHYNITERKLAERNMFNSETRLKEAQAIAVLGNFEIDLKTNREEWSDELYHIYGVNQDEAVPSRELFLSFVHPDDVDALKQHMNESVKFVLQKSKANFRFIRKDGIMRYGYSEARFELDENKKITRIYGILQDVTEAKLAEMERAKMLSDLLVRNNDLEQFGYIISHNLRAPVANIIGATNLLNDTELDEEDREVVYSGINKLVVKLDGVVKDLNHILEVKSEINVGKEKVYFSELVEDIKTSIASLIKTNSINIKFDFTAANEILTIKSYLYSIFYNLITNSIKYRSLTENTLIEIKSYVVNDHIGLSFCDNGIGIDMEANGDQVFGLYKRFHTSVEGKGMGLYMVKLQVEALGGKISVQSTKNKGTEFTILF